MDDYCEYYKGLFDILMRTPYRERINKVSNKLNKNNEDKKDDKINA